MMCDVGDCEFLKKKKNRSTINSQKIKKRFQEFPQKGALCFLNKSMFPGARKDSVLNAF